MKKVTVQVEDSVYELFKKVGQAAGGIKPEQVMADVLFRTAGELAVKAMQEQKKTVSECQN